MRSAGLESSATSFSLSTHQANTEQYQRRADEAENFVNESQMPEATPPEDGRSEQIPPQGQPAPQEASPQQEVDSPQEETPPQSEEESDTQQEESQSRDVGGNLDVRA